MRKLLLSLSLGCSGAPEGAPAGGDDGAPGGAVEEACNGVDDDGDGAIDEGFEAPYATRWFDADGDGYGDPDRAETGCTLPVGAVEQGGDCDDRDATVSPAAPERCNDRDDDCDGEIDELADVVDPPLWAPDADGDGYGDASAPGEAACAAPEGAVRDATDCDDGDPTVHPGAWERCDGLDSDCDPDTTEAGQATFVSDDGTVSDVSAQLDGTIDAPVTRVLTVPGRLELCGGAYHASLRLRADVAVVGLGLAGPAVLSPGDLLPGVVLRRDGVQASLTALTVTGGRGAAAVLGEWTGGGGIECAGAATLALDAVTLEANQADVGAGLLVDGCTVSGHDVALLGNQASALGGGAAVLSGSLTLTDSAVSANVARNGAGLLAVGHAGAAEVTLVDTAVDRNTAEALGGGAWVEGAALSCESAAGAGGFTANQAAEGGALWLEDDGVLDSFGCDWGAGASDNAPDDFGDLAADADGVATFSCTTGGCSP